MLGHTALIAPSADLLDARIDLDLLRSISARRELDQGVKRDVLPRRRFLRLLHEVGPDAANNGLVRDDEDVF